MILIDDPWHKNIVCILHLFREHYLNTHCHKFYVRWRLTPFSPCDEFDLNVPQDIPQDGLDAKVPVSWPLDSLNLYPSGFFCYFT
ncbi:hypothetical protein CDAR_85701 [Caerostris darwini]|uniref:Uncharacterized protein n=1 Tax=Caerostris darwini TaxID=1538125 RepID=A0AAV4QJ35_9ARAC|nr:hypothetical protein CDAR_85701 [Caerostris darwini]